MNSDQPKNVITKIIYFKKIYWFFYIKFIFYIKIFFHIVAFWYQQFKNVNSSTMTIINEFVYGMSMTQKRVDQWNVLRKRLRIQATKSAGYPHTHTYICVYALAHMHIRRHKQTEEINSWRLLTHGLEKIPQPFSVSFTMFDDNKVRR